MRLGWTRNEARVDLEWALKRGVLDYIIEQSYPCSVVE